MNEAISIPKNKLKFIVEITKTESEVKVSATRYIEVPKSEHMSVNAQLAKYDGLKVKDKFHNCNDLVKGVLAYLEECLELETGMESEKHFVLKKQIGHFGK